MPFRSSRLAATVLAIYAVVRHWREPAVAVMAIAGVVSIMFALGPLTPVYGLAYHVLPGVAEFRYVAGPKFCESRLDPIRKRVHAKLGDDFEISFREVKEVEKTPRGKHRYSR